MSPVLLSWLQSWYVATCTGDLRCGVRINTLDTPGWAVQIELGGSPLAGRAAQPVVEERSDRDWVHCRVRDDRFEGYGGPENLDEILERFQEFAQASA